MAPAIQPEATPPDLGPANVESRLHRARTFVAGLMSAERTAEMYRTALAVAMAFVSISAAGLALRTALIGSDAAYLDSAALQESVERQRREQFLGLVVDQDSRLFATYAQIDASRAGHRAELEAARDAAERDGLALEIQAESDLLRTAFSMFQAVRPGLDGDGRLIFDASGVLAELLATDPRLQELRSERSLARAEELHRATLLLIAYVAMLVGALLLLTAAQVVRRPAIASASAALGLGSAVVILALAAFTDPNVFARLVLLASVGAFLPIAIGIEIIVIRGTAAVAASRSTDPPPEDVLAAIDALKEARPLTIPQPTPDPGIGDPRRLDTPFARNVALLIGTATLLAASAAWLQAAAFRNAAVAAGNAQDHAIEAAAAAQRDVGAAEARIDRVTRHLLAAVSATNARQAATWYASAERPAEAAVQRREAERWDALAAIDKETKDLAASEFGPSGFGPPVGGDVRFPAQYLLQAQLSALVEVGLADADNHLSAAWSGQGSAYTGALAVLAVSLYLLGLSLILPAKGIRKPFVRIAGGTMLLVVVVASIQLVQQPADPSTPSTSQLAAATHFAAGDIAMSRAQADPISRTELFALAKRELSAATDLRPEFALAHWDLSTVHIQAGSRQTSQYPTNIDVEACDAATEELETAQRLGVSSALAPWNLGYCGFRVGIARNDPARLALAEGQLSEALALLPDQGILYVNLGAVRLARGDVANARAAFAAAIQPIIHVGVESPVLRPPHEREQIVAAALSELDTVGRWRPDLLAETEELKRYLVSETMPKSQNVDGLLGGLTAEAFGGLLGWRAQLTEGVAAPNAATVSQQWYRMDEVSQEWYVLPEISGDVALGSGAGLRFFSDRDHPDQYFSQVTMPEAFVPPRCLDQGSYRIELYVGQTQLRATLELRDRPQVAELDRLLGVAFCRPEEWREKDASRGHHLSFRSDDGKRGIVALRAHVPSINQSGLPDFVVGRLQREAAIFPGPPRPAPQAGPPFDGEWFITAAQSRLTGIVGYMNLDDGLLMTVRSAIDTTGSVVIVGVFGPPEDFTTPNEGALYVMNTLYVIN